MYWTASRPTCRTDIFPWVSSRERQQNRYRLSLAREQIVAFPNSSICHFARHNVPRSTRCTKLPNFAHKKSAEIRSYLYFRGHGAPRVARIFFSSTRLFTIDLDLMTCSQMHSAVSRRSHWLVRFVFCPAEAKNKVFQRKNGPLIFFDIDTFKILPIPLVSGHRVQKRPRSHRPSGGLFSSPIHCIASTCVRLSQKNRHLRF